MPVYASVEPQNLTAIEEGLTRYHGMMSFRGTDTWAQHAIDTLHQEDPAKVMSLNCSEHPIFMSQCSGENFFDMGKWSTEAGERPKSTRQGKTSIHQADGYHLHTVL
jgi:hypothetical protein